MLLLVGSKVENVELDLNLQPRQTQLWEVETMRKQNRLAIRKVGEM